MYYIWKLHNLLNTSPIINFCNLITLNKKSKILIDKNNKSNISIDLFDQNKFVRYKYKGTCFYKIISPIHKLLNFKCCRINILILSNKIDLDIKTNFECFSIKRFIMNQIARYRV